MSKDNTLAKLYLTRKQNKERAASEFAGLPQRIQNVLVICKYTKESLLQEIEDCQFDYKSLPQLGVGGFNEILQWFEYK